MYFHVWFGTKERKWLLLGEIEERLKEIIWTVAQDNCINMLECEPMVEHIHLCLECERGDLPKVVKTLKGISARLMFQTFPELKLDAQTEHFWQKGYGAKMVGPAALESLRHYIRTQKERPEKYEESAHR